MSRQFNDYSEDAHRLPPGMVRTAYDADTAQYTFRDAKGELYVSQPGEAYGKLTPVNDLHLDSKLKGVEHSSHPHPYRPVYFDESDNIKRGGKPSLPTASDGGSSSRSGSPHGPGHHHSRSMTFADILPPNLITAAPAPLAEEGSSASRRLSGIARRKTTAHARAVTAPAQSPTAPVGPVNKQYPGEGKTGSGKLRATAGAFGRSIVRLKRSATTRVQRDEYRQV